MHKLSPSDLSPDELEFYRAVDKAMSWVRPDHYSGAVKPYFTRDGRLEMTDRAYDSGTLAYLVRLTRLPSGKVRIEHQSPNSSGVVNVSLKALKRTLGKTYLKLRANSFVRRFTSSEDTMNKLAKQLIQLGYEKPHLQPHLRPILNRIAVMDRRPTASRGVTAAWEDLSLGLPFSGLEELHRSVKRYIERNLPFDGNIAYGTSSESTGDPEYYVYVDLYSIAEQHQDKVLPHMKVLEKMLDEAAAKSGGISESYLDNSGSDISLSSKLDLDYSDEGPDFKEIADKIVRGLQTTAGRNTEIRGKFDPSTKTLEVKLSLDQARNSTGDFGTIFHELELEWDGKNVFMKPSKQAMYSGPASRKKTRISVGKLAWGQMGGRLEKQFYSKYVKFLAEALQEEGAVNFRRTQR